MGLPYTIEPYLHKNTFRKRVALIMPNHNKMRVVKLSENVEVIDTPYIFDMNE